MKRMSSRLLRLVNKLLIVLFVTCLGLGWWLFIRTLPAARGEIQAPVGAAAVIARDDIGTPHITAKSIEDAYFAQGFVTAQDRLWQMDTTRRFGSGELSEILGPATIEIDSSHRKLRLRRIAVSAVRKLSPEDRRILAAYARGVNFFIESARGRWAPEFLVLRYEPRPWLIEDTLLCGLVMDLTLTGTAENELEKAKALAAARDKALVERLFPLRSAPGFLPGSNAWAVSGARTATGKPLLANDMHLGWAMPDTWYAAHLKAPGLNVAGVTLPGVPGVVAGHNDHIAWGITNLQTDSQDLYVEKMDLRNGSYEYRGQRLAAAREIEWIAVKGARPVQVLNLITVHGPVHSVAEGKVYSIRWTAAADGPYRFSLHALNTARNWQDFRRVLSGWTGPSLNFVYADVAGNIGYQVVGKVPRRSGYEGDVPADGASGAHEWAGLIPFEELPSSFNPPDGVLVTANQNPFPPSAGVNGYFAAGHRARQIRDRLMARPKWDPEATLRLQTDVYSGYLRFIASQAAAAAGRKGGTVPEAAREGARLFQGWDGQMTAESAAAYVAYLTDQNLRRALMERAAPKSGIRYRHMSAAEVVERLLRERPKEWFDDWDPILATALGEAVEEARRSQGRNSGKWSWGRFNQFTLDHPVAGRIGWIAPYFRLGPVSLPGSGSTVKQTSRTFSPSQRFIADLADWERSQLNLRIGQSAHRLSGHYKDQWEAYLAGRSFPLQFNRVEAKRTLTLRPR
jgi:penicillin amidase